MSASIRPIIAFLVLMISLSSSANLRAQSAEAPLKKFVSRMQVIQNLSDEVESLKVENTGLKDSLTQMQEGYATMQRENEQMKKDVKQLELNLEEALNQKLQSSHTNSVLFIFVFLTGIIVLFGLIWLFMRKPATVAHYQDTRANLEDDDDDQPKVNAVDHQLERIDKLGSLREKGLLTEEEFNLQKKQILQERH